MKSIRLKALDKNQQYVTGIEYKIKFLDAFPEWFDVILITQQERSKGEQVSEAEIKELTEALESVQNDCDCTGSGVQLVCSYAQAYLDEHGKPNGDK